MMRLLDAPIDIAAIEQEIAQFEAALRNAPPAVRSALEQALRGKTQELEIARRGRSMLEWSALMKDRAELMQFFARETAGKQRWRTLTGTKNGKVSGKRMAGPCRAIPCVF
jgi:acyl-CoA reductase-like NAD-dependent aldehyde dehydrogenase